MWIDIFISNLLAWKKYREIHVRIKRDFFSSEFCGQVEKKLIDEINEFVVNHFSCSEISCKQ